MTETTIFTANDILSINASRPINHNNVGGDRAEADYRATLVDPNKVFYDNETRYWYQGGKSYNKMEFMKAAYNNIVQNLQVQIATSSANLNRKIEESKNNPNSNAISDITTDSQAFTALHNQYNTIVEAFKGFLDQFKRETEQVTNMLR